jgi:hypothetical protein
MLGVCRGLLAMGPGDEALFFRFAHFLVLAPLALFLPQLHAPQDGIHDRSTLKVMR